MRKTTVRKDPPRFAELETAYEFVSELGRGGTAVVYLARERELDRYVAIKVIRSTYVEDDEAAARLLREARTVGGLQHPNIVMLYGTRRLGDGSLALIMQYVPGRTLKSEIRRVGALSYDDTARVLGDVGRALGYAHRRRIVHRDIKPENIYLDEESGIARLSDFGIARPWGAESNLTLPGSAIGTPTYMSPEQIDGSAIDGRSDIYALGLVGWEMLTGQMPWAGENLYSIIFKQKNEELPSLESLRPDIPQTLRETLHRALAKRPEDRWADADAFVAALGRAGAPRPAALGMVSTSPMAGAAAFAEPDSPTVQYRRDGQAGPGAVSETGAAPPAGPAQPAHAAPPALTPAPAAAAPALQVPAPREERPAGRQAPAPGTPRRRRWPIVAALTLLVTGGSVAAALVPGPARDLLSPRLESLTASSLRDLLPAPLQGVLHADRVDSADPPAPAGAEPEGLDAPADWTDGSHHASPPGSPAVVYALAGMDQEGVAGDTLDEWLVVRVEDAGGRPAMDASVRFEVTRGSGVIEPAVAMTNEHGLAMARWVVRSQGQHAAAAVVDGQSLAPAIFQALARTGGAAATSAAAPDAAAGSDAAAPSGEPAGEDVPAAVPAVAVRSGVAAGGMHTCLLDAVGALVCWGGNGSGQLGDGSSTRRAAPVAVPTPEPLARLVAGVSHTCAIGMSGAAWCWGANAAGQLGDGSRTTRSQPVRARTEARLTNVATGASHSCALTAAGQALCWGDNTGGQLGDGTRAARLEPVPVSGSQPFTALALGWEHSCALTGDGRAWCWGRNGAGELGDGSTSDRTRPVAAAIAHRFTALAAGNGFTCGLRTDGMILCWGRNTHGQLGRPGAVGEPGPVALEQRFTSLAAGGVHACGISDDGAAYCWGRNNYGQVGDGTTVDRDVPTAVDSGRRFTGLSAVGSHTCGTAAAGGAFCWGFNLEGQLGNASRANSSRPVPVSRQ